MVSFVMTHLCGIKHQGVVNYVAHFAPPSPWWIKPFLFFIEIIGAFIKPLSLAIRLFANIVAGHILLATFFGLIIVFGNLGVAGASVTAAVALSTLDLLVAFIQALYLCLFVYVVY